MSEKKHPNFLFQKFYDEYIKPLEEDCKSQESQISELNKIVIQQGETINNMAKTVNDILPKPVISEPINQLTGGELPLA